MDSQLLTSSAVSPGQQSSREVQHGIRRKTYPLSANQNRHKCYTEQNRTLKRLLTLDSMRPQSEGEDRAGSVASRNTKTQLGFRTSETKTTLDRKNGRLNTAEKD